MEDKEVDSAVRDVLIVQDTEDTAVVQIEVKKTVNDGAICDLSSKSIEAKRTISEETQNAASSEKDNEEAESSHHGEKSSKGKRVGVKRKATVVVAKLRRTPLRVKSTLSGKIKWVGKRGLSAVNVKDSPQQKRLKKEGGDSPRRLKKVEEKEPRTASVKRPKEDPSEDTPNKRLKKDAVDEKTEDGSKKSSSEDDPGEGTSSGQQKEDFTKPKQLRKKKVRRNSVRQNKNGRTKFFKRHPLGSGKNFKRRKKELGVIVPPTKFLLGGNINDPLNLNSLQDDVLNAGTPKSSPLPTPKHRSAEVEVMLPRNMKDPLHLKSAADDAEYLKLLSKKNRKRRKRKRGYSGSGSGKEDAPEAIIPVEEPSSNVEGAYVPPDTNPVKRESLSLSVKELPGVKQNIKLDKIVSPVVPQPGAWKRGQPRPPGANLKNRRPTTTPKFQPRNQRYQYGNYDRYYGYRNGHHEPDLRLQYFVQHPELFVEKDVLDIGCNIGHVTLSVARDFGAKSVVGLDIDKKLIDIARKNVKHYVQVTETPVYSNCASSRMPTPRTPHYLTMDSPAPQRTPHYYLLDSPAAQHTPRYSPASYQTPHHTPQHFSPANLTNSPFHMGESPPPKMDGPSTSAAADAASTAAPSKPFFPISMPILYGPLDPPGLSTHDDPLTPKSFPHNVSFLQGSYVLESDALLATETPQFDTILCLSVTKWIHLNWGDAGLKRAFRRMFAQLRPGGKLVLEAQGWPGYNKKKTLTERIYRNYMSIEFMPNKFIEYLLSPQVGFTSVEEIGAPQHKSKGFRRPINVLTKPGLTPSSCNTPVGYTPYSQRACVRRPVYTSLGSEAFEADDEKKAKDS